MQAVWQKFQAWLSLLSSVRNFVFSIPPLLTIALDWRDGCPHTQHPCNSHQSINAGFLATGDSRRHTRLQSPSDGLWCVFACWLRARLCRVRYHLLGTSKLFYWTTSSSSSQRRKCTQRSQDVARTWWSHATWPTLPSVPSEHPRASSLSPMARRRA